MVPSKISPVLDDTPAMAYDMDVETFKGNVVWSGTVEVFDVA
jgi:hypothetical protein